MSFVHSRDGGPSYFRLCRYDHLYLRLCHGLHCRHMGTCHASFRKGRHIQWFGNRKENCWHWLLKGFIFSFLGFVWIKVDAVVNTVKSYQIAFIYMQQADVMTGTAMVAALWAGTSVESRLRALNVANKLSVHARFSSIAWHCSDWCKSALAFSLPSPVLDSYSHIAYLIGLLTCIVHCVHFPSRCNLFPFSWNFELLDLEFPGTNRNDCKRITLAELYHQATYNYILFPGYCWLFLAPSSSVPVSPKASLTRSTGKAVSPRPWWRIQGEKATGRNRGKTLTDHWFKLIHIDSIVFIGFQLSYFGFVDCYVSYVPQFSSVFLLIWPCLVWLASITPHPSIP